MFTNGTSHTSHLPSNTGRRVALAAVIAIGALTLLLTWTSHAANTVEWQLAANGLPTTTYLNDVAFGDVNNDGKPDLVGAHTNNGGLVVWAGDGTGNWSSTGMTNGLPATGFYARVALADVNSDGKLDIVATGSSNNGVHAWLGDGTGTWTETSSGLPTSGTFSGVAVSDLDKDGRLDIFASAGGGIVTGIKVYLNVGGAWSATTSPTTTGAYRELAVGYVDTDGYLDVVAANYSSVAGVYVWRGTYDGNWLLSSNGLTTTGGYRGVALGDINNDGKPDIVVSRSGFGGGLHAYLGDGTGTWTASPHPISATGSYGQLALGDINTDGWLDLLAGGWSPQGTTGAYAWLGSSDGWAVDPPLTTSGSLAAVALGDLDSDGLLDVAAGDGSGGGVLAWRDTGVRDSVGTWTAIASPQTTGSPRALAIGDLNLDGNLDVVVARPDGGLNAWTGDGGNSWTDCMLNFAAYTGTFESVLVGQFNRYSQYPDVIGARWDNEGIEYYYNNAGACYWNGGYITGTGSYRGLSVGDINANGYLDLVAAKWAGGLRIWENGINGWTPTTGPTSTGTFYDTALGDLNHDGKLDIAAASYDGLGVRVYLYSDLASWLHTPVTTTGEFHTIAVGDLNGDGHLDVAAAKNGNVSQQGIYLWLGDGMGNVWTPWPSPVTTGQYFDLDLGDFNHDGKLDILAARDGLGVSVWAGDGAGNWTPYNTNLPTSGAFFNVLFGHIDHDGNPDILSTQLNNGLRMWTAAEASPPTFSNFWPDTWTWINTTQSPSPHAEVVDTASGLNVTTAAYRYSTNGGASWSGYFSATVGGANGVTSTQVMTASTVPFGQDSATQNVIELNISDMAGNTASEQYVVKVDTTPPSAPTTLSSSDHSVSTWSNDDTISVGWSGASDATSGVHNYSVLFDQSPTSLPDTTSETGATSRTSAALADGNNWYAHVRTKDFADNWSTTARHAGPYWIDTAPPNNPTNVSSSSHTPGVWSSDSTISMNWSGASDGSGGGVSGYSFVWDTSSSTLPDTATDTTGSSTTSPARSTSSGHYFHIRTRDAAGNWAATAVHRGPYYVDITPPSSSTSSPASVSSTSFTVNWSGSDTSSGIASYDVQYRNKSTGGSWTTWRSGVSYNSATFYGQNGHIYQFRSRARDNVGNLESYPYGYDSQTSVATIDLFVKTNGIEVNQAVQDLNNSVTLIASKRTFVRCHVQSDSGTYANVPARLRVYRGATYKGTLLPANPGAKISVRTSPDRGQLNHGYYFDVPLSWINAGSVRFECEVNTPRTYGENSYSNNTRSATVSFVNAPVMNLLIVDVPYRSGGVVRHVRNLDRTMLASWLRRAYPIKTLNVWWGYLDPPYNSLPSANTVNGDLAWNKSRKVLGADEDPWTRYYGMAIDTGGFMRGKAHGIPSTVASGPTGPGNAGWDFDGSYGDWYGGHELGHTYGRYHAEFCGAGGGVSYPYPNGDISPTRDSSRTDALYGLDVQGPVVYPPSWKDVMTYCNNEWVSDFTYEGIYSRMIAEKPVTAAQIRALRAAGIEYLAVFGSVITSTDVITLHTLYRVPDAFDIFGRVPGDYSIRLLGVGGAMLADYAFTPRSAPEDGDDLALITEFVPWVTDTQKIVILHGATPLVTRTVSANAPTVTLLSPNGGETLTGDSVTVSWAGTDADDDSLTYSLDYSRDGGATWEPLSANITGTQAVLDLTRLPGSTQGRFQVWVSDGVNTALDVSDGTFTVTTKGPSVALLGPPEGSYYVFSQTITFEGSAFDPEDGPLADSALQWTSSLSGALGNGNILQLDDLITGTHVITLTATDSHSNTITATTRVLVDVASQSVYLPVVLRNQ